MNQSRAFIVSLIVASCGMFLVYLYVSQQKKAILGDLGAPTAVVIAAKDINEMQQITADMLTTVVVYGKYIQPHTTDDPKAFIDQYAMGPIKKGEQMMMTKVLLSAVGSDTGLSQQVAITKRALSIPVNEVTGVTKLLKPGDSVDIIAGISYKTDEGRMSELKTLLQNVQVLAVGEYVQNHIPHKFEKDDLGRGQRAINLRNSRSYATVTVEVSPSEAQTLVYAITMNHQLFLTLRNPVDRMNSEVATTTVDEVLGENSKKAEARRQALLRARQRKPASVKVKPKRKVNPFSQGGGVFE